MACMNIHAEENFKELSPNNIWTIDNSTEYFPVNLWDEWHYKGYKKKEPDKVLKIKAVVIDHEEMDDMKYYYYSAPDMDMRYLVRKDADGVYLRVMRYPFPLFNFSIEVDIIPEMKTISFPLSVGKKWNYEGKDNVPTTLKITDTGLIVTYFLAGLAILSILFSEIVKYFK